MGEIPYAQRQGAEHMKVPMGWAVNAKLIFARTMVALPPLHSKFQPPSSLDYKARHRPQLFE